MWCVFFRSFTPLSQPLVLSIAQMDKRKMHTKIPISHGYMQQWQQQKTEEKKMAKNNNNWNNRSSKKKIYTHTISKKQIRAWYKYTSQMTMMTSNRWCTKHLLMSVKETSQNIKKRNPSVPRCVYVYMTVYFSCCYYCCCCFIDNVRGVVALKNVFETPITFHRIVYVLLRD